MTRRPPAVAGAAIGVVALAFALIVVRVNANDAGETGESATSRRLAARDAWARPTPQGATRGVVYLSVSTDRRDAIVGAQVPAAVARAATLHQTDAEGHAGHHGGSTGDITMTPVERIPIVAGTPVIFEPGGNHIMLDDLVEPLRRGQRFELTLLLGSGRAVSAHVTVSDRAVGGSG